jgi:myo-inositol-1(or 4)-monophosphatase
MDNGIEKLIKQLAVQGGTITAKKFGKVGVEYTKADIADVVTVADLAANKAIIAGIKEEYPDHDIISEEIPSGARTSNYAWIIDPLDGTRNFVTKMPLFCTMIAFTKNDEVRMAAIYDPIHKDLYFARKGRGAFLNGRKIKCSDTKIWERSFGLGTGVMNPQKHTPEVMRLLMASAKNKVFWMGILGSVGISMTSVAAGKRDWAFSLSGSLWDYAPVSLMLEEAGCTVTNTQGKPWKLGDQGMIVGNKYLQPKLLKLIKKALR